ncbi:hypothetical protein ACJIZ3_025814 [Penstemon smallii]|uniref:BHLH domain-containing protein n=1 Tax=Penstemon smallii TaxID=265156 RepID=A0ABD3TXW5_9LAMI
MDSDSSTNYFNQNSGGLLRFRSAPSSLLDNYVSGVEKSKRFGSRISMDDEAIKKTTVVNTVNYSQLPPQYPRQNGGVLRSLTTDIGSVVDSSSSIGKAKLGSGLMRQNSSPVGFFSHLNSQNGYAGTRGMGSCRLADDGANEDISSPRLKNNHMTLSSSLGMLSQIREVENENGLMPFSPWNDTSIFAESFTSVGIKRELGLDHNLYTDTRNGELENRPNILSHHLSLPKTSAEMATMEKLLQLQDSVPCKIRAKRGCATHPRSIAERVRRTRISERMRKLQELVPNMDKQTNTSDMLDLAVEYIKNLQKHYKTLSENRANCKCLSSQN